MEVYPDKLEKISEASTGIETSALRKYVQDYSDAQVVGISAQDGTGNNKIYPLLEFIEKLADAVVTSKEDLIAALTSSDSSSGNRYGTGVSTIYIAKDIVLDEAVTLGRDKVLIGTSAILKINSNLTVGNYSLYSYCKVEVTATRTITGTGALWFKDILCPDTSNFIPFTAANATSKYYERCVKKSDYLTDVALEGWTKKFIDNTFPYKNIYDTLQSLNNAIIDLRNDVNYLANNSAEGRYIYGVAVDNGTGTLSLLYHDVKTDFNNVPDSSVNYDLATRQATKAYVDELRDDVNRLAGGGDGEYVTGVTLDTATGALALNRRNVETGISTRKSSEDYAVPTVKATQELIDGKVDNLEAGGQGYYIQSVTKDTNTKTLTANTGTVNLSLSDANGTGTEDYSLPTSKAVVTFVNNKIAQAYKPKGNAYIAVDSSTHIATLHTGSASGPVIIPDASMLGYVYNIANAPDTEEEYTFKDSSNNDYSIYISKNEDVGIVEAGSGNYVFNDFGGKINLEDYYTKHEIDTMSSDIAKGDFIIFTPSQDPLNPNRTITTISAKAPGVYNASTPVEGQVIITPESSPNRMKVGLLPDAVGASRTDYGILPPIPASGTPEGYVLKIVDSAGSIGWGEIDSNISYLFAYASSALSSGTNLNANMVASSIFPNANPSASVSSGVIKLKAGIYAVHAFIEVKNSSASITSDVENFSIYGAAVNSNPYRTISWDNSYEHTEIYELSYIAVSNSDDTNLSLNTNALNIAAYLSIKVKYIQIYCLNGVSSIFNGNGNIGDTYNITSTDGTLEIFPSVVGSQTTFDIGLSNNVHIPTIGTIQVTLEQGE